MLLDFKVVDNRSKLIDFLLSRSDLTPFGFKLDFVDVVALDQLFKALLEPGELLRNRRLRERCFTNLMLQELEPLLHTLIDLRLVQLGLEFLLLNPFELALNLGLNLLVFRCDCLLQMVNLIAERV